MFAVYLEKKTISPHLLSIRTIFLDIWVAFKSWHHVVQEDTDDAVWEMEEAVSIFRTSSGLVCFRVQIFDALIAGSCTKLQTRWWFQTFFIFTLLGEIIQFDDHMFQMGWNHQVANVWKEVKVLSCGIYEFSAGATLVVGHAVIKPY